MAPDCQCTATRKVKPTSAPAPRRAPLGVKPSSRVWASRMNDGATSAMVPSSGPGWGRLKIRLAGWLNSGLVSG